MAGKNKLSPFATGLKKSSRRSYRQFCSLAGPTTIVTAIYDIPVARMHVADTDKSSAAGRRGFPATPLLAP
jgi:hypothetical protein